MKWHCTAKKHWKVKLYCPTSRFFSFSSRFFSSILKSYKLSIFTKSVAHVNWKRATFWGVQEYLNLFIFTLSRVFFCRADFTSQFSLLPRDFMNTGHFTIMVLTHECNFDRNWRRNVAIGAMWPQLECHPFVELEMKNRCWNALSRVRYWISATACKECFFKFYFSKITRSAMQPTNEPFTSALDYCEITNYMRWFGHRPVRVILRTTILSKTKVMVHG